MEEIVAEVERCFRDYGGKKGYIFAPYLLLTEDTGNVAAKNAAIAETANRLRYNVKIT